MKLERIKGITLTPVPDQPGYFEILFPDPNPYFFTRSQDEILNPDPQAQVFANLRAAYLIGGYVEPRSLEFKNGINATSGLDGFETANGKRYVTAVEDGDWPGMLRVSLSTRKGVPEFDVQIHTTELSDIPENTIRCEAVIMNIGMFLRKKNMLTIDADAINAVKRQQFWW